MGDPEGENINTALGWPWFS